MKFRNTLVAIIALGTFATTTTTVFNTNQALAAVTSVSKVVYASSDTIVYSTPAGNATTQTIKSGTAWKVTAQSTANNQTWYELGTNQWVNASAFSDNPTPTAMNTTMYVVGQYGAPVFNSPYVGGTQTGQTLPKKSGWKVTAQVNVNGNTWYQVGGNQWVWGADLSVNQPVEQAPGRTMNATAYDPRVLGNYTFGYDTVAANLSVFPRGTKLRISFANGTTKDYVVRDTGSFAYANPNQIDIAMPNWQALQFGRQNVTVSVIS